MAGQQSLSRSRRRWCHLRLIITIVTGLTDNYLRVVQAQVVMTPLEKRKIDQEHQVAERERVWSRW